MNDELKNKIKELTGHFLSDEEILVIKRQLKRNKITEEHFLSYGRYITEDKKVETYVREYFYEVVECVLWNEDYFRDEDSFGYFYVTKDRLKVKGE